MSEQNQIEPEGTELSARQEALAACLASGSTIAAACRKCDVGKTTAFRWLQQQEFTARVQQLRKNLLDAAVGRLANMMAGKAAFKLFELLDSESESLRLEAIQAVYDLFLKTTSNLDLKAELEAIKASLPKR